MVWICSSHVHPGQLQLSTLELVGSYWGPMPVVKASYSFGLLRRFTRVAQSTTWRSMLNPTSSSCCFETRAKSYIHLYSCVVMKRIGSPLYPASWSSFLVFSLLCSFQGSPCIFTCQAPISWWMRL